MSQMADSKSKLTELLHSMWADYTHLNPAAGRIYKLLTDHGESVLNDHIALRTFAHPRLGIEQMAQSFKNLGYTEKQDYHFKEKKLYAKHYEHSDETLPKIFISELLLNQMSERTQKHIDTLVKQLPDALLSADNFTVCGRPWNLDHATYLELAEESEYASWVAAIGFRPNHFTVNVNQLKKFASLESLNQFIQSNGYKLNSSGGVIKGTPEQLLEQSSTMAEHIDIQFNDGTHKIPGCYYEFAKRYAMPNGKLYTGFIAASADKIFESTNRS